MSHNRRTFIKKTLGTLCAVSGAGKILLLTTTYAQTTGKTVRYGILHDETACIGCTACEEACRTVNKVPAEVSRLHIIRSEPQGAFPDTRYQFFRHSCQHCDNPPCVEVCPTGASFKDEQGIVDVNGNKCVGCQYCLAACPYHVRFINPVTKSADKCDFCKHTNLAQGKQPACVEVCPTRALTFGNLDDPESEINKKIQAHITYRSKISVGTDPALYRIPDKRRRIDS